MPDPHAGNFGNQWFVKVVIKLDEGPPDTATLPYVTLLCLHSRPCKLKVVTLDSIMYSMDETGSTKPKAKPKALTTVMQEAENSVRSKTV